MQQARSDRPKLIFSSNGCKKNIRYKVRRGCKQRATKNWHTQTAVWLRPTHIIENQFERFFILRVSHTLNNTHTSTSSSNNTLTFI